MAHEPIRLPALKLSVAKVASTALIGSVGVSRSMTKQAGVARLLDGRHDRRGVGRHDGKALGAGRDQVLDGRDLAVIVAVELAGIGLERQAELVGLGLRAFAHLDEERVAFGLGDQADDRLILRQSSSGSHRAKHYRRRRARS